MIAAAVCLAACGSSASSSAGGNVGSATTISPASGTIASPATSTSGGDATSLTLNSTCTQYIAADESSQATFFQSVMAELAIQTSASIWASNMVSMCQGGDPSETLNQVLVNSGDLGPGQ